MLVPVAFGALTLAAALLAARLAPEATRLSRACATAVLTYALAIGVVYVLGAVGAITTGAWVAATLVCALAAVMIGGPAAWAVLWSDGIAIRDGLRAMRGAGRDAIPAWGAMVAALIGVSLAALSTYLLAPWAWDSLGYHLPIVHDALQTGTLRRVPTSVVYVNVYPRLVDVFFIAWRLSLADDTWIELGQLPIALGGVVGIAALAERVGVPAWRGLALGCLWLAVPVTMLELAAAYVDVAVGALGLLAFALATLPPRRGTVVVAGIAIGLMLGSKPSAPPIAAIAMMALLVTGARSRQQLGVAMAGCAIALAIGAGKFVENVVEWHNPIWPAHVEVAGHALLPGKASTSELALVGMREPYLSMSWAERVLASWTAWPDVWVYDMRIGGFGPLFTLLLLPLAIAVPIGALRSTRLRAVARSVGVPALLLAMATLISPGAFWARYTLAIPGAMLALAIAVAHVLPRRWGRVAEGAAVALALLGIALSWRGFTEDTAPSLFALMSRPAEERHAAQAVDAQERDWQQARALVRPGEAFGYDPSFNLPGRLWRSDGRGRVVYLERTTPSVDELLAWCAEHRVRVMVLGEGPTGAADTARAHPDRFRELFRSRYPQWQPSAVFEILDASP
ncbi:hypothetical protein [Sandaracinus amylolyticus]|uniref:Nitrate/nitrite transporter n=1 Tax=Sandaracinus amylolyticus TaxID=927083 RepID=A0A0F6W0X8_9BACT|nr:hypothetical protein [Sandaracinus amylolyticus]AKF04681.1 Nitrate/nitrite transporter [Sandaracinus amylolyticus]